MLDPHSRFTEAKVNSKAGTRTLVFQPYSVKSGVFFDLRNMSVHVSLRIDTLGAYIFWPLCLSVCPFVCPQKKSRLAISFDW